MAKNKKKKKNPIPAASDLPKNEPGISAVPAENKVWAEETDFEKELSSLFEEKMTDTAPVSDEKPAAQAEVPLKIMSAADSEKGAGKKEDSSSAEFAELFAEETEKLFEEMPSVSLGINQEEKIGPAPMVTVKKEKKKNKKEKNKTSAEPSETPHDEFLLVPSSEEAAPPAEEPVEKPAEQAKTEKPKKQKQKKEQPAPEEAAKREQKPVDEGSQMYLLRLVLVLTIISAVIAGMLAVVNYFTKDIIAGNALREKEAAVLSVFPEGDSCKEYVTPDGDTVYFAASGDYVIGYCVNVSPSGYSSEIDMMVGVGSDGSVTGIKIVSMSETPGVGTKVNSDSFLSQFIGRTNSEPLAVGENVDGIGGATFSSKAVTAGVSEALAVSFDLHEAAEEVGLKVSDSVNVPNNVADANDDNGDDILMPGEVGEVDETGETLPVETDESVSTEQAETETQSVETETAAPETAAPETLPPETLPDETLPVQGEIEVPAVSEIETETGETEETETEPPIETLTSETEPEPETLPPETEPPVETLPPETEPVAETLPPERETEPVETEPAETDDIIIEVEIIDDEPEETEEAETEETEETEKETKKNNSSNRGPIIIR